MIIYYQHDWVLDSRLEFLVLSSLSSATDDVDQRTVYKKKYNKLNLIIDQCLPIDTMYLVLLSNGDKRSKRKIN